MTPAVSRWDPPPPPAQTRTWFSKSAETRSVCAMALWCNTYRGTHVADIIHTNPSQHDNPKHYPHLHNSGTTQLLEFWLTGTEWNPLQTLRLILCCTRAAATLRRSRR